MTLAPPPSDPNLILPWPSPDIPRTLTWYFPDPHLILLWPSPDTPLTLTWYSPDPHLILPGPSPDTPVTLTWYSPDPHLTVTCHSPDPCIALYDLWIPCPTWPCRSKGNWELRMRLFTCPKSKYLNELFRLTMNQSIGLGPWLILSWLV